MMDTNILVLATLDTKSEETDYLVRCLEHHGTQAHQVDISLNTNGALLDGDEKIKAMNATIEKAIGIVSSHLDGSAFQAVLGIGGGTGGEIALRVMQALPITFPKVLVTTLPFDPRIAVADSSIVMIPTLADICGLNATLREVLENAAAMTAGLCKSRRQANACVEQPSMGITALGATQGAVERLLPELKARGHENTVFHSNGYGGAAFTRFCKRGAFKAIIELTPHELTRIHIAGAHVDMPERFTAGSHLPRVVLPGAMNFIGLGKKSLVPGEYLKRSHYQHSGFFTHAKVTHDEMRLVTAILAEHLNQADGPVTLIVPMGGFSHRDCPGGEIEDVELRHVFLEEVQDKLDAQIDVKIVDAHISAPEVTRTIIDTVDTFEFS